MTITWMQARERLEYDPESGKLFWKAKDTTNDASGKAKAWNGLYAGKETGSGNAWGYLVVNMWGTPYRAHRLAWAIYYGEEPPEMIDHINGNRTDNRLCNLRAATATENVRNRVVRKDSRTGLKGVTFHSGSGKWRARISVNKTKIDLGLHGSAHDAAEAYQAAAIRHFGEYAVELCR